MSTVGQSLSLRYAKLLHSGYLVVYLDETNVNTDWITLQVSFIHRITSSGCSVGSESVT